MTTPHNKKVVMPDGTVRSQLTLDPFAFILNTFAMGDVIATVPVIKHMVDSYYPDPSDYRVVAKKHFRCLFPFVPDSSFIDFDDKSLQFWGIPDSFAAGTINKKAEGKIIRTTPKRMLLGEYSGFTLGSRVMKYDDLKYVPLDPVDVSHFNLEPKRYVILVTSYRDYTRSWKDEYIIQTAEWLMQKGYVPVFVGKTDMDAEVKDSVKPKSTLPADCSVYGVDLRNKTTIPELASLMANAAAVCGVDCGPVHLAGTTAVPIVCGYTSVSPEYRIPVRDNGKTYAIVPDLPCIGCESRWHSSFWNYENCYIKTAMCVDHLTAKRFTDILDTFL